jgi:bifunctional enzyme CysN/CysC
MATGASTASLAVILVDARKGLLDQTRRHSRIVAMMGVPHVVLAVNKMDLVGYSPEVFARIVDEYRRFAEPLGFRHIEAIPVSRARGRQRLREERADGLASRSHADAAPRHGRDRACFSRRRFPHARAVGEPPRLRFPRLLRPHRGRQRARGRPRARAALGRRDARRGALRGFHAPTTAARATRSPSRSPTRSTYRAATCSPRDDAPQAADQFEARILWMSEHALVPGRPYLLKLHARETNASVTAIKYREDVETARTSPRRRSA